MKTLLGLLRLLTFQLAICQFFRLLFILLSPARFDSTLIIGSMWTGLAFDLGVSLLVVFLVLFIQLIVSRLTQNAQNKVLTVALFILILIQALASLGDIILYKYWDSIFSIRAYPYLKNIGEMMKNVSWINGLFAIFFLALTSFIFHYSLKYLDFKKVGSSPWYERVLILLVLMPISFLVLRGGFREIPRNQSDAFFCDYRTYNMAAINSTWNFFNVLVENQKFLETNPYRKLSEDIVLHRIHEIQTLAQSKDVKLFNFQGNPNIVLITMEGVSAEVLNLHNRDSSYMPFLESLIDSSYYFANAYAVGSRTEQGLGALLSGSLATPYNSLTDNVSALSDLPSIVSTMKDRKYHTRFVFGGNVEFANMRAYLTEIGFDTIIDILNFPKEKQLQSLGVPDEYLFQELIVQYRKMKSPFFLHTLTLSTHEPFDIPKLKTYSSERKMYLQSAAYLDKQLQHFFTVVRQDKKFKNTLFVIISDHSHKMPNDCDIASKERYHIPLLLYSHGLNSSYRGYKDSLLFAQQNLPATLSYLLNWKEKNYLKFSRNHFSDMNRYSISAFVNGYLYQTDTSAISYDYVWRPYDTTNQDLVMQHSYPQAILQYLADQIRGVRSIKEK